MNWLQKIKSVFVWTPKKIEEEPVEIQDVNSRRRFIRNIIAAGVGGILLPPVKTIVTVPVMPFDLSRAHLRPLQQPLYDSEVWSNEFSINGTNISYFQRPALDFPKDDSLRGFDVTFKTIGPLKIKPGWKPCPKLTSMIAREI